MGHTLAGSWHCCSPWVCMEEERGGGHMAAVAGTGAPLGHHSLWDHY